MKRARVAFTVVGVLLLTAAAPGGAETFAIVGAGGPQGVLRAAAAAFAKANPGVTIEVPDSVGTGGGYKAVGEGEAAMGRVGRPAKGKEVEYGLEYVPFAKSPAVFFTHPGVTVKGLTAAQTVSLFSGKATSWKDVGGPDEKVRIVTRQPGGPAHWRRTSSSRSSGATRKRRKACHAGSVALSRAGGQRSPVRVTDACAR